LSMPSIMRRNWLAMALSPRPWRMLLPSIMRARRRRSRCCRQHRRPKRPARGDREPEERRRAGSRGESKGGRLLLRSSPREGRRRRWRRARWENEVGFRSARLSGPDLNENFARPRVGVGLPHWAGLKRIFCFAAGNGAGGASLNFGSCLVRWMHWTVEIQV
jgi:hypothetical protein